MRIRRISEVKRSVSVVPESGLDLLNLFRVVGIGDVVFSETRREVKRERASGRMDSERVSVVLGVEVSEKWVDPFMRRIGFRGRIVYESKPLDLLGKHHTIRPQPGQEITIQSRKGFERLKAFAESFRRERTVGRFICVALDGDGVAAAEFSDRGLRTIFSKRFPQLDKSMESSRGEAVREVFGELAQELRRYLKERGESEIVLLGPQIFLEEFQDFLRKEARDLAGRVSWTGYVSVGREEGVREAMRSGVLERYAEAVKPLKDAREVERFIEVMAREPERVAVGLGEVMKAWRLGAVEKILVSEGFLWEHVADQEFSAILDAAESGRLELQVLLDGLEASEKVGGLGGVVAFLRYPLPLKQM